jgi:hypothetical protein
MEKAINPFFTNSACDMIFPPSEMRNTGSPVPTALHHRPEALSAECNIVTFDRNLTIPDTTLWEKA